MNMKKLTTLATLFGLMLGQYVCAMQNIDKKIANIKSAKTARTRAKRFKSLMNEIEAKVNKNEVVSQDVIHKTRELIRVEKGLRDKKGILDRAEQLLKRKAEQPPKKKPVKPVKLKLLKLAPASVKKPAKIRLYEAFFIIFDKTVDQFIDDMQIPQKLKKDYSKFLLYKIVQKIMDGRKIYPGPGREIGSMLLDQEKQIKEKGRGLTRDEIEAIKKKFYPKKLRDKIAKMARNRLANEVIDKYFEENLTDEHEQLEYRRKLIKAFTPESANETKGYNIDKLEFPRRKKPEKPTGEFKGKIKTKKDIEYEKAHEGMRRSRKETREASKKYRERNK